MIRIRLSDLFSVQLQPRSRPSARDLRTCGTLTACFCAELQPTAARDLFGQQNPRGSCFATGQSLRKPETWPLEPSGDRPGSTSAIFLSSFSQGGWTRFKIQKLFQKFFQKYAAIYSTFLNLALQASPRKFLKSFLNKKFVRPPWLTEVRETEFFSTPDSPEPGHGRPAPSP